MKLLNRQPQISSLRARMLFGAATLALALGALTAGAFSVEAGKSLPAEAVVNNEKAGGTLSGTVFDPSGARVPRANVTILDKVNGAKQSTATNESGEFSFTNLPADGWNLTVMKPGFVNSQTTICSCEKMPASLNIVLSPGEVYQTVTVTGAKVRGATPAPAPAAPERIRVGGSIEAAKLIAATHPDYPESVRAKGIQGEVLLEAVISKDGIPISFKVITSPNEALSRSALDAVKTWRYKPTLLNGNPIEVATTIAVNFQLRD